jgi:hypothetical protein
MAQTQTQLYNLAAQVIGGRGKLVSTSDKSRYVEVFDLWYDPVRAIVLKAAHWPSAQKSQRLNLNKTRDTGDWQNDQPAPGAGYAYTIPSDMLYPRYLSSYGHFTLGMLGDTKSLFAHEGQAILTYTFDQTNPDLWEPELFFCIAHALAAYSALTLTGKQGLSKLAQQTANGIILRAQSAANNEDQDPIRAVASWHAARGYVGPATPSRYIYPFGAILAVGESASVK